VTDIQDVVASPEIDVVAVVTPVSTHFDIAKAALLNGSMFSWKSPLPTLPRTHGSLSISPKKTPENHGRPYVPLTGAVKKIKNLSTNRRSEKFIITIPPV